MEEKNTPVNLKFLNHIVNSIDYKSNLQPNVKGSWQLTFDITNTTKVNKEQNKMDITLGVSIFKGVENAPFNMDVVTTGYFALEGEDDITKYEANAINILYPYLRAIISNYTSSENITPVTLPTLNLNAILNNKNNNKKTNTK